jgi:hypothetical protein
VADNRPISAAKQIADCRRKQRFESEREADNFAYRKRMEGIRVSIYECEWCGGWHLTSRHGQR